MEIGLLLLRVVVGSTMVAHGAQKLFGLFGGPGIRGTGGFFGQLGLPAAGTFAVLAGLCEFVGGTLVLLGFFTPIGAGLILAVMLVATVLVHAEKGFFNAVGGYELPLIISTVVVALAIIGPGQLSLDESWGIPVRGVEWVLVTIAIGLGGALVALATRAVARKRSETPA